jgi:hypothetical protein
MSVSKLFLLVVSNLLRGRKAIYVKYPRTCRTLLTGLFKVSIEGRQAMWPSTKRA